MTTGATRCEILPIYPPPRTADTDERRITATFYFASLLVLMFEYSKTQCTATVKRNGKCVS